MALIIATDVTTNIANGYTLAQGDTLFVQAPINIYATGSTFSGVVGANGSIVDVRGTVLGNAFGITYTGGSGSSVYVGANGTVAAGGGTAPNPSQAAVSFDSVIGFGMLNQGVVSSSGAGVRIVNAVGQVENDGTIGGATAAVSVSGGFGANLFFSLQNDIDGKIFGNYDGTLSAYQENIVNLGSIYGNVMMGGGDFDVLENHFVITGLVDLGAGAGAGHGDRVLNFGKIGGLKMGDGADNRAVNAGEIFGEVTLGNGANQVFDSSLGTVFNVDGNLITGGSKNDTIVGAENGGIVRGGGGDDVLIANQTDTAPSVYHAMTTLDGGAGTNALYGGGGLNVFDSGDATYNQIWGGVSQLAEHEGYYNNTVDYHSANAGVYVDLLNGHNAYVGDTAGQGWTGTGRFEDSIANVPNVVGTGFADVIIAGSGHGDIWGGLGADQLYAGVGPESGTEFVYNNAGDSNLNSGYDTIVGFKIGTDQINLTAFATDASHVLIQTAGTSNTVYWEKTPGDFNANTDLAIVVNATTATGLTKADFIF